MATQSKKPIAAAVGAAFLASVTLSPLASASGNPFRLSPLSGGYNLAEKTEHEGKCGGKAATEGKCGGKAAAEQSGAAKQAEGKCGEGKCGEGKCGGKVAEGKCGEGHKTAAEGKCGEGKCGGAKQ